MTTGMLAKADTKVRFHSGNPEMEQNFPKTGIAQEFS
jgi:hypothetical protein